MQTKPLRNYGIDVTQTSFKPLMEELGLEKSVSELTQAEKEILRYISTLRQAKNAMGDFANTIESPANQLKVLKQQFYEMQAAIGNLFVGAFARILPYVNAVIMVIKELAKTIAALFGIRMKDYNSGIATFEDGLDDYSDALDGVGSSADSASDAIKALKRQTLAFDQINNLTSPTPSSSSGSSGGGIDGAIDENLLAALEGYENGMKKVRMRATEIRDIIMEWLGFQKEINEETGETYFSYDTVGKSVKQIAIEISTNLANMLNFYTNKIDWTKMGQYLAEGINVALSFIDTFFQTYDWRNLGNKIGEFLNSAIKNIDAETLGRTLTDRLRAAIKFMAGFIEKFNFKEFAHKLGQVINSAIKNIPVDELVDGLNNLVNGIETAIGELIKTIKWGEMLDKAVEIWKGLEWDTKLAILAPILAIALGKLFGSSIVKEAIKAALLGAIKNGLSETGTKLGTGGSGGVNLGALLGWGSVATIGIALDIKGYSTTNTILDNLLSGNPLETKLKLIAESSGVDENTGAGEAAGKGALAGLGIANLFGSSVGKVILAKTVGSKIMDSLKENNLGGTLKNLLGEGGYNLYFGIFDGIIKKIDEANAALFGFGKTSYTVSDEIVKDAQKYFDSMIEADKQQRILKALTEGNYDEIEKIIKETSEESAEHVRNSLIEQTKAVEGDLGKDLLDKWSILAYTSKDKYKEAIKQLPTDLQTKIQEATGVVVTATPEMAAKFAELSKTSEKEFMIKFNKLPEDVQKDLLPLIKEQGGKIPDELQQGINSKNDPKVNVQTSKKSEIKQKLDAQTKDVTGNVNVGVTLPTRSSLASRLGNLISGVASTISLIFGQKADGGVFANGRWQPIQAYANGGIPSGGQLFMAREAGPELVGKIGRHTAVMNNNQIVDSVKAGVYEAVSAAMSEGGMGSVQIDLHTDEGVVVDRINRITRQTGNCPIDI